MVICAPGDRLCDSKGTRAGPGTYTRANGIFSSLVGNSVIENGIASVIGSKGIAVIPSIGSTIIGQVKRINSKLAIVSIMMVGKYSAKEDFEGVIRY